MEELRNHGNALHGFKNPPCPGCVWQGRPCLKASTGQEFLRDQESPWSCGSESWVVLKILQLWGIYEGELHMGRGTNQRDVCTAGRVESSKLLDTGHRARVFDVRLAGFWSCFGPVFPHCAPVPPF